MTVAVSFSLSLASGNDAFQSDPHSEIGRILDAVARAVQTTDSGACYDLNGNAVGRWSVTVKQDT